VVVCRRVGAVGAVDGFVVVASGAVDPAEMSVMDSELVAQERVVVIDLGRVEGFEVSAAEFIGVTLLTSRQAQQASAAVHGRVSAPRATRSSSSAQWER
jgi:hypothetical protein